MARHSESAQLETGGLVNALKAELATTADDGRTVEEQIAHVLVEEALHGKHRLAAIQMIFDRVEGKPHQSTVVAETTDPFAGKTKDELLYFAQHGYFPEEGSGGV